MPDKNDCGVSGTSRNLLQAHPLFCHLVMAALLFIVSRSITLQLLKCREHTLSSILNGQQPRISFKGNTVCQGYSISASSTLQSNEVNFEKESHSSKNKVHFRTLLKLAKIHVENTPSFITH